MSTQDSTSFHGTPIRWTVYRLPDPLDSFEELRRFLNEDLADMSPAELWAERQEARRALAYLLRSGRGACIVSPKLEHIPGATWLRERVRATEAGTP